MPCSFGALAAAPICISLQYFEISGNKCLDPILNQIHTLDSSSNMVLQVGSSIFYPRIPRAMGVALRHFLTKRPGGSLCGPVEPVLYHSTTRRCLNNHEFIPRFQPTEIERDFSNFRGMQVPSPQLMSQDNIFSIWVLYEPEPLIIHSMGRCP
jgi:hypothetical protein